MVQPKGRLCLLHGVLAVEPQAFYVPIKRYLENSNRQLVYQRIKQRISELETLFTQNLLNDEEWVKEELCKLIDPVRNGIINLKETYQSDSQMCAYLDILLSRFHHICKIYLCP